MLGQWTYSMKEMCEKGEFWQSSQKVAEKGLISGICTEKEEDAEWLKSGEGGEVDGGGGRR